RDVKPENVLRMGDGRLVVSDFGLAVLPGQASAVSGVVGTPLYMSPEVVMAGEGGMGSDVGSLGVVIHGIVFGKRPEWEKEAWRGRGLSPPVGRHAPKVERAIARLCAECLSEHSRDRPRDAVEVKRRFALAAEGKYRGAVRRWVRRGAVAVVV